MIIKNSNQFQPLKTRCLHYEWWVNRFEEVQRYKTLSTVRLNKTHVINDVITVMKTLELSGDIVFDIEYSIGRQTGSLCNNLTIVSSRRLWFRFF